MIKIIDQRKEATLQWLQDPSEISVDILNNVRRDASIYFRNKKREYLKENSNGLASKRKNKYIKYPYRKATEGLPTEKLLSER
jgi:hypothetical protein